MTPEQWARYAAQDTYADVEKMVQAFAKTTANTYHIPLDDAVSAANLGFVQAFRSYNPDYGFEFTTWCGEKVKRRLQDLVRKTVERAQEPLVLPGELGDYSRPDQEAFDLQALLERLSPEARETVMLVFDTPTDVLLSLAQLGSKTPEAFRSAVREFLTDKGWSKRLVKKVFAEIKENL